MQRNLLIVTALAVASLTIVPASPAQVPSSGTSIYKNEAPAAPSLQAPQPSALSVETFAERRRGFVPRAGAVAANVFRVLASQHNAPIGAPDQDLDAFLRPPDERSEGDSIFREAKELYDGATSYRTTNYDLSIDPLSLKCRVRINLNALLE